MYIHYTKDWGLLYWHDHPVESLPAIPYETSAIDASLQAFPSHNLMQLVGLVNAAHATNLKTHKSVTGIVFTLAGGAIAYKSKLQATIATSSTKSELIITVTTTKMAKYLCSVLAELGFPQDGPTHLYEDNMAAIAMVNKNHPPPCAHHINIQYFAIQEWHQCWIIEMFHIPGIINVSDAGIKALTWQLHTQHTHCSMGHFSHPCSHCCAQLEFKPIIKHYS
jgi:hypothetical protein